MELFSGDVGKCGVSGDGGESAAGIVLVPVPR